MGKKTSRVKNKRSKQDKILVWTTLGFVTLSSFISGWVSYDTVMKPIEKNGVQYTVASVQPMINYIKNPTVQKTSSSIDSEIDILKKQADNIENRLTILLAGVDSREDKVEGRSDAMILLSIDREEGTLDMVSIPRDSYVPIIGHGTNSKITHAFAYGGRQMMQDTVENMFNMQIDHYAVFNFTSVLGIIDVLGGIEVNVPFTFTEQDSKGRKNAIRIEKGLQTLNGEEALAYARMRKQDSEGDIGRGKRQQQVIEATLSKLTTLDTVKNFKDVYSTVKSSIDTDVSFKELLTLMPYLQEYEVQNHVLRGTDMRIGGTYYMQVDKHSLESVKSEMKGKVEN